MGKPELVTASGIIAAALADFEYRDATFDDVADDVVKALATAGFRIVPLPPVNGEVVRTVPACGSAMLGAPAR